MEKTNLLPFTMNAQKFHCQPQSTSQHVCNNCMLLELSLTILYAGSSIQNMSEQFISCKGKAIPLQAWTGPEGSRRLRLPNFMTIGT
jgi:hypothetical protein